MGKWAVVPFAVLGTDEHGQLQTKQMIPLTSASRFRCGMQWVHVALAAVGYGEGKRGAYAGRTSCFQGLARTPVVREITAAISAKRGYRRTRLQKNVTSNGCQLPTFVEVEVRGRKLTVGTVSPFYLEWSVDVVNWLIEQLKVDATVDVDLAMTTSPSKEFDAIDRMAAATCSGHAAVTYAPSKRAFSAVWGDSRARAFFTVRRGACRLDGRGGTGAMEAEVAAQFARAEHWASSGEKLPCPDLPSRRKRRRPVARRCSSASSQGADTDDAHVTPKRSNPRTPSEAGSQGADTSDAHVTPKRSNPRTPSEDDVEAEDDAVGE